jgi:glycosidase
MMHLPKSLSKLVVQKMTRDQARTPMQWSNEEFAGFSKNQPWMIVNPNYQSINVESQLNDEKSILNYTKVCVELYKRDDCFAFGNIEELFEEHKQLIAYRRFDEKSEYQVFINLSNKYINYQLNEDQLKSNVVLTNYNECKLSEKMIMRPYEAFVLKVK